MWTEKSNKVILEEIGHRLKEYRMRKELQQIELAERAGTSRTTIQQIESGKSIGFENLIKVLRALDMLENLEMFIPKPPMSPILMRKLQEKKRKRIKK